MKEGLDMKKNYIITIIIIGLIICGLIINALNRKESIVINEPPESNNEIEAIYVQISGAVVRPGVYEMTTNDRVHDLIILAGGFTKDADIDSINLAQKLIDGMKIIVSQKGEQSNKISINKATIEELKQLEGIGDVKARAIVEFRELNGPYTSIEDLVIYKLISEKDFARIKDDICL